MRLKEKSVIVMFYWRMLITSIAMIWEGDSKVGERRSVKLI